MYPKVIAVTASGAVSGQASRGDPLEYEGSPDIPCRLDVARHYRVDGIFNQELVVEEFELHVPSEAPLPVNVEIVVNGHSYEVRKHFDYGGPWTVTKYAIVTEILLGADND
jgi:hypothetical protein